MQSKTTMQCANCQKEYKLQRFYDSHVKNCVVIKKEEEEKKQLIEEDDMNQSFEKQDDTKQLNEDQSENNNDSISEISEQSENEDFSQQDEESDMEDEDFKPFQWPKFQTIATKINNDIQIEQKQIKQQSSDTVEQVKQEQIEDSDISEQETNDTTEQTTIFARAVQRQQRETQDCDECQSNKIQKREELYCKTHKESLINYLKNECFFCRKRSDKSSKDKLCQCHKDLPYWIQKPTNKVVQQVCDTKHCETCTCFAEKHDSITIKENINKQHVKIARLEISKQLPSKRLYDTFLRGQHMFERDLENNCILRDVEFNVFDSTIVQKRLIKNTFAYSKKYLSQIKKVDDQQHTYLNFRNGITNYEATLKYIIENKIKFTAQNLRDQLTLICYDLEATDMKNSGSQPDDFQANTITMITAIFSKNNVHKFVLYILNVYQYDETRINQFIKQVQQDLKSKDTETYEDIIIKQYGTQQEMCIDFLQDVNNAGLSFLISFNGSSSIKQDKIDENGRVKKSHIGYDLPFILYKSQLHFKLEIEHGTKLYNNLGKQIRGLNFLQNTYVLDANVICQNSRYFAMKSSDMPNKKLNTFLKFADLPLKLDDKTIHERMAEMRKINSDQTDCINYCLWDSFALYQLIKKIGYLSEVMSNIESFNAPLSWALYKNSSQLVTMYLLQEFYDNGSAFSYSKFYDDNNKKESIIGATTSKCPEQYINQVQDNIGMLDYASLYPSSIIANQLSIENVVDQEEIDQLSQQELDKNYRKININFADPYLIDEIKKKIEIVEQLTKDNKKISKCQKVSKKELQKLEQHNNPKYVYFKKQESIFVNVIVRIFKERFAIKKEMTKRNEDGSLKYSEHELELMDAKQNALKIFINTLYGLMGCFSFQLYDARIAQACTSTARYLTYLAQKCGDELNFSTILFRDTDSSANMIKSEYLHDVFNWSKRLNDSINSEFQSYFDTKFQMEFKFESENFQLKTYYPRSNKAYCRIEVDYKEYLDCLNRGVIDCKQKLKIKGVSWSLMSSYGQQFFKNHTEYILKNLKSYEQIQQYVLNTIKEVKNDIDNLIQNKNWQQLQEKYHKQIKNSANNSAAKYLRQQFDVKENELQILPIVKNSKLKNQCIIPAIYCDQYTIDKNQLIEWFISPFKKFYGQNEYEQEIYEFGEDELISIKKATNIVGYHAQPVKMSLYDAIQLLDNKKVSCHEVITKSINKLFFDIDDSLNHLNFMKCLQLIQVQVQRFTKTSNQVKYAYTKSTKTNSNSYHIVFDIRCNLYLNKYIAEQVNYQMQQYTNDSTFQIIDLALYALNKSLRLPLTPKIAGSSGSAILIHDNIHEIKQGSIQDLFLTNIQDCENELSSGIGFLDIKHKELPQLKQIEVEQNQLNDALKQYIKVPYKLGVRQGNFQRIQFEGAYECPVCKNTHDNKGLQGLRLYINKNGFAIKCWSLQNQQNLVIIHEYDNDQKKMQKQQKKDRQQERNQNLQELCQLDYTRKFKYVSESQISYQHNKQVEFNLDHHITYVISNMMTGKTKQQVQLIRQKQFDSILALSFRQTFTLDNSTKNQFVSYQNINGQINLNEHSHVIIQVDSLHRLAPNQYPKLLIIDEAESIMEQLISIQRSNTNENLQICINILRNAEQVLLMDANLEEQSILAFNQKMESDNFHVFFNTYKCKENKSINIYDYIPNNDEHKKQVRDILLTNLDQNKKTVLFTTSQNNANDLYEIAKQYKPDIKIKKYTGQETSQQIEQKKSDFQNVNDAWKDVDLLIYTSTLTAGISYELQSFHSLIGVYYNQTCSPNSFTQGLHRVRNISDDIHLFIEQRSDYLIDTPFKILQQQQEIQKFVDISENQQFHNFIKAANNHAMSNRTILVIRDLKNMGYRFQLENAIQSCVLDKQQEEQFDSIDSKTLRTKRIAEIKITIDDVNKIPKIMKNEDLQIQSKDNRLNEKYMKIKLFKTFFKDKTQEDLDLLNSFEISAIQLLLDKRDEISKRNKIKIILSNVLNQQPELKTVTTEQIDKLLEACRIEAQQNLNAYKMGTTVFNDVSRSSQDIYNTMQAVLLRDKLQKLDKIDSENVKPLINELQNNIVLKRAGFKFNSNGQHHALNTLLKYIDLELNQTESKRVKVDITEEETKEPQTNNEYKSDTKWSIALDHQNKITKTCGDCKKNQEYRYCESHREQLAQHLKILCSWCRQQDHLCDYHCKLPYLKNENKKRIRISQFKIIDCGIQSIIENAKQLDQTAKIQLQQN